MTAEGGNNSRSGAASRLLDVLLASALLLLTLPVLLLVLLGSALSLRAWPIFTQTRIGLGGEHFRFLKVRTMPTHAPRYTDKYSLAELALPRFTRLLRATHLDELPQLVLVLMGRMSLVGPRPEMPHLHRTFNGDFAKYRTRVRPGCTGLWQVSTAGLGMIHEAPEWDLFYVEHRTFRLDLWVLWRTGVMVFQRGNSKLTRLDQIPSWLLRPEGVLAAQTAAVLATMPPAELTGAIAD